MTQQLESGYMSDELRSHGDMKAALEQLRNVMVEMISGAPMNGEGVAPSALTISSGAITPTVGHHSLQPESGTADNLDTVTYTNHPEGRLLILRTTASGDTITVRHAQGGNGEIKTLTGNSVVLSDPAHFVLLVRISTYWQELWHFNGSMSSTVHGGIVRLCHPSESADGARVNFSTADTFKQGTLEVFIDNNPQLAGIYGAGSVDVNEDSDRQGYTFGTAPPSGSVIWHRYQKEAS